MKRITTFDPCVTSSERSGHSGRRWARLALVAATAVAAGAGAGCGGSSPEARAVEARGSEAGASPNAAAALPGGTESARGEAALPGGSGGRPVPADVRVVLVTGSTGGLGREVARRLAANGDHVIVHGRDEARGRSLVAEIAAAGVGGARFYAADFAALDNVRALAERIRNDYERLDVLVNNAGILVSPDARPVSADGHELHFQVNYLSGFLLTHLLLPLLEAGAPARIVNVASRSAAALDFDDIMLERAYSTSRAYGQSKLAQIMFTLDLAARLDGPGVTVNAIHPASRMDTDLVRDFGMTPRTTVDEGAEAVMRLVDADDVGSGRFFSGLRPARAHRQAYDEEARTRLWSLSERLTGVRVAGPRAPD